MADKKRIGQNPLDSLMPEKQESDKPEKPKDSEPESQNTIKTEKQDSGNQASEKVKATYYMEAATEQQLESAWLKLRQLTGRKVSKSEIVEAAILSAAGGLEERGADSQIFEDVERLNE